MVESEGSKISFRTISDCLSEGSRLKHRDGRCHHNKNEGKHGWLSREFQEIGIIYLL